MLVKCLFTGNSGQARNSQNSVRFQNACSFPERLIQPSSWQQSARMAFPKPNRFSENQQDKKNACCSLRKRFSLTSCHKENSHLKASMLLFQSTRSLLTCQGSGRARPGGPNKPRNPTFRASPHCDLSGQSSARPLSSCSKFL